MIKIGITGRNGFVGTHLANTINLYDDVFTLVDFKRDFFDDPFLMDDFVMECDVIVHLAAINRHDDQVVLKATNIKLVEKLIDSINRMKSTVHIIISSSSQEDLENLYGESKKEGRLLLANLCNTINVTMTGLIIPNVFGPFGLPNYNSVVATFCYKLTHNEIPEIKFDSEINLIYIGDLVKVIIGKIRERIHEIEFRVEHTDRILVSDLLLKLKYFKELYLNESIIPRIESNFDLNLFNTFRSFFDIKNLYPKLYKLNEDTRGTFVEIIRLNSGGQFSFSTTKPGVTRGNHFHTRKIERFSVIKGKALIQLRKIGTNDIFNFELDGDCPSFIDMPIWYTHNIKNIGDVELFTNFWINEFYHPEDPDTYFENV